MDKNQLRGTKWFHIVNPAELETLEEWAEYLDAILNGPCSIREENGELILLEIRELVDTVRGMRIEIYPKEHAPPHFHVRSATVDASFRIDDCSILKGKIANSDYDKIRYWHKFAKPVLIKHWNSSRPTKCTVGLYRDT